jgi:uncharacterized membrane protein YidH (DUF202 family)
VTLSVCASSWTIKDDDEHIALGPNGVKDVDIELLAGTRQARRGLEGNTMSALKIVAVLLIVGGIIGLVYGGITYTKTTHDTKIGPIEVSVTDKETVNVPVWAGVGAIVVGGALLLLRRKD